jgi:ABC-type transporter MlaC component/O-antigen ligase
LDTSASGTLDVGRMPVDRPSAADVRIIAALYGAWLVALTIVSHRFESKVLLELTLLAGAAPALAQSVLLPADTRGTAPGLWFLWAFALVILASYVVNDTTWEDLANVCNVIFVFIIGFIVASCTDASLIQRIAAAYAVLVAPYLIYVNVYGAYIWGRLSGGAQPNLWGLISLNVAVGALCMKRRWLAAFCWAVVLLTLYNAQARGSMVALVPVVFAAAYGWWIEDRSVDGSWKVLAAIFLLIAGLLLVVAEPDFFVNKIMRLNDPYRGLQSGVTGRDETWGEALRLWFASPLLGVGFRKHEQLMVFSQMSSHNAYIAMLADTGFLGFLLYVGFLALSMRAGWRSDGGLRLFLLAVIASYSLAGLFERRAINVGNAFSITFVFACLVALRFGQPRAPVRGRDSPTALAAAIAPVPCSAAAGSRDLSAATAAARLQDVREMVEAYLDIDAIARATLGRFGRSVTERQWREYRPLLRDLIVYAYAAHFSACPADSLQVGRVVAAEDGTAVVHTRFPRPADGLPVAMDWRIGAGDDGFKVRDVVIDGISVAKTMHADFAAIIVNGGVAGLLAVLRRQVYGLRTAVA